MDVQRQDRGQLTGTVVLYTKSPVKGLLGRVRKNKFEIF